MTPERITEVWSNIDAAIRELNRRGEAVEKFLSAQGHDLCHENRRELATAFGLEDKYCKPQLTLAEFDDGCLEYQRQIFGESASDNTRRLVIQQCADIAKQVVIAYQNAGRAYELDKADFLDAFEKAIAGHQASRKPEVRPIDRSLAGAYEQLQKAVVEYLTLDPLKHPGAWSEAHRKLGELSGFYDTPKGKEESGLLGVAAGTHCPKCYIPLQPGQALQNTVSHGTSDFPGQTDKAGQTFSFSGEAKMIDCMKCPECGFSRLPLRKTEK